MLKSCNRDVDPLWLNVHCLFLATAFTLKKIQKVVFTCDDYLDEKTKKTWIMNKIHLKHPTGFNDEGTRVMPTGRLAYKNVIPAILESIMSLVPCLVCALRFKQHCLYQSSVLNNHQIVL